MLPGRLQTPRRPPPAAPEDLPTGDDFQEPLDQEG
jgi:hypothetical protein